MESFVHATARIATLVITGIATLLILAGAMIALVGVVLSVARQPRSSGPLINIRQGLARWLSLALEFAVAADVLLLAVTPSWNDLGMLAAVVALRMGLNFSLERELSSVAPAIPSSS